jgi:hypothetical protein
MHCALVSHDWWLGTLPRDYLQDESARESTLLRTELTIVLKTCHFGTCVHSTTNTQYNTTDTISTPLPRFIAWNTSLGLHTARVSMCLWTKIPILLKIPEFGHWAHLTNNTQYDTSNALCTHFPPMITWNTSLGRFTSRIQISHCHHNGNIYKWTIVIRCTLLII